MKNYAAIFCRISLLLCSLLFSASLYGQVIREQPIVLETVAEDDTLVVDTTALNAPYFRSPTKAALYSAIAPGLGQAYNKKYWKVPVVLGLLATGVGFITYYNGRYDDLRSAFLAELNGEPHEFSGLGLSAETLANSAEDEKRFRDYAIVITAAVYILNILDAAVDAHLYEVRNDPDLTIRPEVLPDETGRPSALGLGLSFRF